MADEASLIQIALIGSLVFFVFVIAIILFVILYNRKLEATQTKHQLAIKDKEMEMLRQVIETQESEREKIAQNLHDEVGPLLSTLKLNISRYKIALKKGELKEEDMDREREFIDSIIENVRSVSHDLSPQLLLKFGLVKALQNFTSSVSETQIQYNVSLDESKMNKQTMINVYRIALELLNNLLKHDLPKHLTITLAEQDEQLLLKLEHDGRGISSEEFIELSERASGMGLNSMTSRVLVINGQLRYDNSNGARVELTAPLY